MSASKMRVIGIKYRDKHDPLFRGSPKDLMEILKEIQGAAFEGKLELRLPIHISDDIYEELRRLNYEIIIEKTGIIILW